MIYQSSRYYNQLIDYVSFVENEDELPIVFYTFDTQGTITWTEHVYQKGERLDQLSFQYYGRPDFWWVIPEYNPEIDDFSNIPPGTVLRIPRV
jgi:nucleoid-associated protein YgaU